MHKQDPVLAGLQSETYLGFDFGNKKIGTAVGQLMTKTASPLMTIRSLNQIPDWDKISGLISEWQPTGLVVGVSRQAGQSEKNHLDKKKYPIMPKAL
jgi:putative Holliday junction resolvase